MFIRTQHNGKLHAYIRNIRDMHDGILLLSIRFKALIENKVAFWELVIFDLKNSEKWKLVFWWSRGYFVSSNTSYLPFSVMIILSNTWSYFQCISVHTSYTHSFYEIFAYHSFAFRKFGCEILVCTCAHSLNTSFAPRLHQLLHWMKSFSDFSQTTLAARCFCEKWLMIGEPIPCIAYILYTIMSRRICTGRK